MDNKVRQRVEQRLQEGFKIETGKIFEKASEIFKGIALYAIIATLIYFVSYYFLSTIISLVFPMSIDEEELQVVANSGDIDAVMELYKEIYTNTSFLISIFLTSLVSTALYPIVYSVYTMAKNYDLNGKNAEFSDLFIHYKDGKFLKLFLITLIVQFVGGLALSFCFIPGFIVFTMWMLTVPLIIFAGSDIKDSLTLSMKLAFKNFGSFFVLLLIAIAVVILGFILCCIGVFAAIPFVYVIIYVLYKEIIGFDEDNSDEISQIGTDIYKDNPYMK